VSAHFDSLEEFLNELSKAKDEVDLLRQLANILTVRFGIAKMIFVDGTPGARKTINLQKSVITVPNVMTVNDRLMQDLKDFVRTHEKNSCEEKEGFTQLILGGKDHCVAIFPTHIEKKSTYLVWEALPGDPDLRLLDQFIRLAQRECRWYGRLQSANSLIYRDDLTGLYNHRFLDVALDQEMKRVRRFGGSFSILFIDLDNFKKVNDRYGHLVGSSILKQVASRLHHTVRDVDIVIRYGGDEYNVILIGASLAQGLMVGERIRKNIADQLYYTPDGQQIRMSVSIGVAACPETSSDKMTLLKVADESMYRSKRSGKNRVSVLITQDNPELLERELSAAVKGGKHGRIAKEAP